MWGNTMSTTDLLYLCMLLGSIPFGHLVKLSGSPSRKQFLSTVAGVCLSLALVGVWGILHSFWTILGTYVIVISLGPRRCEWVAFLFVFGYLFFFRTCKYFGFEKPPEHSNAIQLLVTLRCCTLPFEIFESEEETSEGESKKSKRPSFYEFLSYSYCYCGLTTGPYYRYKTFKDMINQQHPEKISTVIPAMRNLQTLPFFGVIYLILNHYFPISHIGTPEYTSHPWGVLYQLAYLVPTFNGFRWRFYIGWLLAESCCMTLGLGAYPFETEPKPGLGPTKAVPEQSEPITEKNGTINQTTPEQNKECNQDTHSFETIHNINIFEVEFSPTMGNTMKNWNMTVQWWIATYIHRKTPFKNKSLRMFTTLLVSAFWHGVAPGYYLTFLCVPLTVIAEVQMSKAIKPYLSPELCYWYDWLSWFFHYRSMEYLGCGFMLIQLAPCLEAWKSMYFVGHIVMAAFIVIPFFIPKKHTIDKEAKKKSS